VELPKLVEETKMMPIREFLEEVARNIISVFDMHGEILPMYHIVKRNGDEFIMPPPQNIEKMLEAKGVTVTQDEIKDLSISIMRKFFEEADVVRYAFFDEAWIVENATSGIRPKEHPDRKEIILLSVEDENQGLMMAQLAIIRIPNAKPFLGPMQIDDSKLVSGRLAGLLPHKGKVH